MLISVVVPSYQRRSSLLRLLASLDDALDRCDDAEVVVVLDGSTDGSAEALERAGYGFPLRWHWQPNGGRSAARNAGVAMARGSICWLVDDDMTVDRTAYETHVEFHRSAPRDSVLMGPQVEHVQDEGLYRFLHERAERLANAGVVVDPFDFWTGNVSMPQATLLDVGGFCEDFDGWGEEDVELGFRLHKAGVPVRYHQAAGGHHWRDRPLTDRIVDERERGRNIVRLCELHPEATARIFPSSAVIVDLHQRNLRSPAVYGAIGRSAAWMLRSSRVRASGQRDRIFNIGISAARLAGMLEAGGSEHLQRRATVNHRLFHAAAGIADQALPAPSKGPGDLRAEYAATGMLRHSVELSDRTVVDRLRADAQDFVDVVDEMRRHEVQRVPYAFTPAIEEVACDPNLTAVVEELFGDDRWVAWGANIQVGTPNDAHRWHTDIESLYWPSVTVVVGIAGCREGNATRYLPGSHRFPVGPSDCGDAGDEELVLETARMIDPRCGEMVRFDGFGDGRFTVFDAKGWHCGDSEPSADRLALFLHYQRADDPRIPYMRDHTEGTWFDHAAPFMPNPRLGDDYERSVHPPPHPKPTRSGLDATRQRVRRLADRRGLRGATVEVR